MNHRLDRGRALVAAALAFSGILVMAAPVSAATGDSVVLLPTTGDVDAIMADYLTGSLQSAADSGARAVVIRLNTPGGSLEATQRIVSAILEARVPVIVWVAPSGGYAASAGTFITLSANLAYMAPGTRIGAASPIDSSGQDIPGTLGEKVKNDAIAWVTSIAQVRHRPVDWAVSTVATARSSPANEAVALGAVDAIASTIDDVLGQANGKVVQVRGADRVLDLTGVQIREVSANPLGGILGLLADPNIAFILFTLGVLALVFELQSPTVLVGIAGLAAIALATIGFVNLPVVPAGLLLVAIGLILLALEPAIPSHGLLTIGGIAAFVLGGSALYSQGDAFGPAVRVAAPILITAALTAAVFGALITLTAIRTRRMAPPTGADAIAVAAGTIGEVRRPLEPFGSIYAGGEEWTARAVDDRSLPRGAAVRVVRTDGLTLVVEADPSGLP